jgi:hypothetical protein
MKKASMLLSGIAGVALLALATPTFAAGDEVTLNGEAKCAKCALKEKDKCQTVIMTEGKDGKPVKYYVADNDVAKAFHKNVCQDSQKVTATGTVKEKEDGKKEFTATKIDIAK